jgi:hypothetical protein
VSNLGYNPIASQILADDKLQIVGLATRLNRLRDIERDGHFQSRGERDPGCGPHPQLTKKRNKEAIGKMRRWSKEGIKMGAGKDPMDRAVKPALSTESMQNCGVRASRANLGGS